MHVGGVSSEYLGVIISTPRIGPRWWGKACRRFVCLLRFAACFHIFPSADRRPLVLIRFGLSVAVGRRGPANQSGSGSIRRIFETSRACQKDGDRNSWRVCPREALNQQFGNDVPRVFDFLTDLYLRTPEQCGLVFKPPDYLRELCKPFGTTLDGFDDESEYRSPMPARYVTDRKGIISAAAVNADYTSRPEPGDTVSSLKKIVEMG